MAQLGCEDQTKTLTIRSFLKRVQYLFNSCKYISNYKRLDEGDVAKVLTWTKISAQLVQHGICKGVIDWPISATDSERNLNMNVAIK